MRRTAKPDVVLAFACRVCGDQKIPMEVVCFNTECWVAASATWLHGVLLGLLLL